MVILYFLRIISDFRHFSQILPDRPPPFCPIVTTQSIFNTQEPHLPNPVHPLAWDPSNFLKKQITLFYESENGKITRKSRIDITEYKIN